MIFKDVHKAAKDISELYKDESILYIPFLTYFVWFIILFFAGVIGKFLMLFNVGDKER